MASVASISPIHTKEHAEWTPWCKGSEFKTLYNSQESWVLSKNNNPIEVHVDNFRGERQRRDPQFRGHLANSEHQSMQGSVVQLRAYSPSGGGWAHISTSLSQSDQDCFSIQVMANSGQLSLLSTSLLYWALTWDQGLFRARGALTLTHIISSNYKAAAMLVAWAANTPTVLQTQHVLSGIFWETGASSVGWGLNASSRE